MAGILETNGANISMTAEAFASYDTIRYSAAMPNAPVTLTVTDSAFLDLSAKLVSTPATIYSSASGSGISSGEGGDTLIGNSGKDSLFGHGGSDTIYGNAGQDYLDGGAGDDYIDGGSESDTIFGDTGSDTLIGGAGDDYLGGGADNDTLDGGAGADLFNGGAGDDTFIMRAGEATQLGEFDYLSEEIGQGTDTLRLIGVNQADILITADGKFGDLTFRLRKYVNGVTVTTFIDVGAEITAQRGTDIGQRLERVVFDDGTVWDFSQGLNLTLASSGNFIRGTDLNDTISADASSAAGYGGLYGYGGNDTLTGRSYIDTLDGGAGNDTLDGAAGADKLTGGTGDDTFIVRVGEGGTGSTSDVIYEDIGGGTDTLRLVGLNPSDVTVSDFYATGFGGKQFALKAANGSVTNVGVDGQWTVNGGSDIGQRVEKIVFDDGTVWDLTSGFYMTAQVGRSLTGSDFDDVLTGNIGNEKLSGAGGADTINGGAGNDQIHGDAGADTLSGGADDDVIYGDAGTDSLTGNEGNDTLYGGDDADVLDGGAGVDALYGGAGADTYILRPGEGGTLTNREIIYEDPSPGPNTLKLVGIAPADVTISDDTDLSPGSKRFALKGSDGTITYVSVKAGLLASGASDIGLRLANVVFDDGTVWDLTQGITLTGSDNAETIIGTNGTDTIFGLGGADTLYGYGGDDTISGGSGTDTLYGGEGADLLDGSAGDDVLYGGGGADKFVDRFGANTIYGESGDDLFFGVGRGDGIDTLSGGEGSDTYVIAANLDNPGAVDVVTDFNQSGVDVINLGSIASQFIDFPAGGDPLAAGYARFIQSGSDALLQIDRDGSAGGASFVTILRLQGVDATTLGSANLSMALIDTPPLGPDVVDDTATTDEDVGVLIDVLANDTTDHGPLTLVSAVDPNGGAILIQDGKLFFTPAANFNGVTNLDYVVVDALGNQSTATVKVTVQPVNDAPTLTVGAQSQDTVESGITPTGGTVYGWTTAKIQLTKSDPDIGDVASYETTGWTAVGGSSTQFSKLGTYGTVVLDITTGLLSYTLDNTLAATNGLAAGATATDAFSVTVTDSAGVSVTQSANFIVRGTNDAPTLSVGAQSQAVVESGVTPTNGTVYGWQTAKIQLTKADPDTGDAASFDLTGWTAVEGSASQFTRQGTYGSVVLDTATGLLSYTLDNTKTATNALKVGTTANDAFTITVKDTAGGVVTKTASFVINGTNDAPTVVAGAQSQAIVESGITPTGGTVYGWQTAKIQLTRTDPEGDATSYDTTGWTAVDGSATQFSKTGLYGSVVFDSATGLLSYTLDNTKANGIAVGASAADGFAVTVKDALGGASTKTVSFVVTGTNDAPTLTVGAQSQAVVESGVTPTNGTVYGWQTAKIQLTKADPDTGDAASFDLTGWTAVSGSATQLTKTGTYGSVVLDTATGLLSYTLDNTKAATNALKVGTTASDAFSVTVKDLNGGVVTKTASFVVTGTNDAPTVTFGAQSQAIVESGISASGGTVYGWQTAWLQVSKSDPEGDATSYDLTGWTAVDGSTTQFSKVGLYGSAVFDTATSRISYTLDNSKANGLKAGATANDGFAVIVKDALGGASTKTANFVITGTNDAPTLMVGAQSQAIVESGLTSTGGTIYGWATAKIQLTKADPDGDATSYDTTGWTAVSGSATQFTKLGTYGSVVLDIATGLLSYTLDNARPATNALEGGTTASDNFTVTLKDGLGGAVTKVASFAIQGTNDGVTINGTAGADTISAGSTVAGQSLPTPYADTIYGNGGNDSISGLGGKDILDGGDGIDAVSYSDKTTPVVLTLNGATFTTVTVGGVAEDQIRNFETIVGGYGSDSLTGDGLATIIYGLGGDDILNGAGGDDRLVGGLGMDTLTGGSGRDSFVFDSALGPSNLDTITDFSVADDVVQLSSAIFTALSPGALAAADFVLGSATNTAQNIIYAPTTGALSYDSDGTGSAASVQFATLAPNLALTAANFRVT